MGFLIDMIAVGQGDALLLTLDTPGGEVHVLIDGGPPAAGDLVADFVTQNAGGHLHTVIASHLDIDHVGGLERVVARCTIENFYVNLPAHVRTILVTLMLQRLDKKKSGKLWDRIEESLSAAAGLVDALGKKGLAPQPLIAGQYFPLGNGDLRLNVLNPTPARLQDAWTEIEEEEEQPSKTLARVIGEIVAQGAGLEAAPETTAENNSSIVLEVVYKGLPYALLTADAGADVLREVTANKRYPLLKVPHHGSNTGLDEALIAQLRPATAFIPVGPNNYGHPANDILDLLRTYGAATYCSERVNHCRQACPATGARHICHAHDRALRPTWGPVARCSN